MSLTARDIEWLLSHSRPMVVSTTLDEEHGIVDLDDYCEDNYSQYKGYGQPPRAVLLKWQAEDRMYEQ